ncbi:MAG TPA: putative motility protein [Syntrophorhabdaceae bacterium]|nr:putative motility protein [Syntrophorhabdaceae bacterium]
MIDPVSSIFSYVVARSDAAMSIAKNRMEAEAAVAQAIMEAAQNIEQIMQSTSGPSFLGSNIDIYV